MIPLLIGAGIVLGGAALLSDDDDKKSTSNTETTHKRIVSENVIRKKLQNGRKIRKVGGASTNSFNSNFDKLRNIIVEQLGVEPSEVVPSAELVYALGADDLDLVELILAVEEEFNVEIPDKIADRIETVGDLFSCI